MDDSDRAPLEHTKRSGDMRDGRTGVRKLFRFDPTVSTGTLLQLGAIVIGASMAYGTYREDRAQTHADIEQVKHDADRDREDVKAAFSDFRDDMKTMKADMSDVKQSLAVLKAQSASGGSRR